jgi:hypothetical protein
MVLYRVISGGQNGADLAGLTAAYDLGYCTGGTAPKNYRVCMYDGNDGVNLELKTKYELRESDDYSYPPRTEKNVVDSNGTAIFGYLKSPGCKLTIKKCLEHNKLLIKNPSAKQLENWIIKNDITILNIAGNRVSAYNPNIYNQVYNIVYNALTKVRNKQSIMTWNYRILSTGEIIECYYNHEGKPSAYTDGALEHLGDVEYYKINYDPKDGITFEEFIFETYKEAKESIERALSNPILDIKEFDLPIEERTICKRTKVK